jgi:TetR/AcrR family transcriptional regulator, transcriptional repressor for nem operon
MPWPKEHKRQTRERILDAAAAAFREHGVAQVGIADIMRRAGLTHGGFYAHFASKDDLLAAAFAHASTQSNKMLETLDDGDASTDQLLNAALAYLSSTHLAHPEHGCPVPSFGAELMRNSQKARATLTADIRKRLKRLNRLMPEQAPMETKNRLAAGALACMVGGMILARGLNETEGSEYLKHCRDFLREALAKPDRRPELPQKSNRRRVASSLAKTPADRRDARE